MSSVHESYRLGIFANACAATSRKGVAPTRSVRVARHGPVQMSVHQVHPGGPAVLRAAAARRPCTPALLVGESRRRRPRSSPAPLRQRRLDMLARQPTVSATAYARPKSIKLHGKSPVR